MHKERNKKELQSVTSAWVQKHKLLLHPPNFLKKEKKNIYGLDKCQ